MLAILDSKIFAGDLGAGQYRLGSLPCSFASHKLKWFVTRVPPGLAALFLHPLFAVMGAFVALDLVSRAGSILTGGVLDGMGRG